MSEIQLKQQIIQKLDGMEPETLAFVDRFLDSLVVFRQLQQLNEPETSVTAEQRLAAVKRLRGLGRQSSLSSDDFACQKQAEIDWEERNS